MMSAPPSPEEAARTVEQASLAFLNATTAMERSAAERWLLEIRKWPQPLACCRELLLRSMVGYAKLQALIMMRECLGTQWPMLSPAERSELQQLLLRLLAEGSVEPYVRAAAAQNLAVHAKHDLLHALPPAGSAESGAPAVALETLLQAATQMLEEPSGAHAPAALEIMHATLSEFGAPSSGVVGGALPWSMHARARCLPDAPSAARRARRPRPPAEAVRSAAASPATVGTHARAVCNGALECILVGL